MLNYLADLRGILLSALFGGALSLLIQEGKYGIIPAFGFMF